MAYSFVVRNGSLAPRCNNGNPRCQYPTTTFTTPIPTPSTTTDQTESSTPSEDTSSESVPTPSTTESSATESNTSGTTATPPPISSTPSSTTSATETPVFSSPTPPTIPSPPGSPTTTSTPILISSSISKWSISTLHSHLLTSSTPSSSSISSPPNNPSNPMLPGTSIVNVTEPQSGGSSAISIHSGGPDLHASGSKPFIHNKGAIAAISSILVFIFLIIMAILIKIALRRRRSKNFDKVGEAEGEEEGEIPVNTRFAKSIGYDTSDGEGYIAYRDHLYPSPSLKRRGSDISDGTCYNSQMGYYGFTNLQVSNGAGRTNYQVKGGRGGKEAGRGIVGEFYPFSTADVHTRDHDDPAGDFVVFKNDDSKSKSSSAMHDIDSAESNRTDIVSPSQTTFDIDFTGPSTVQPTPSSPSSRPPPLSLDNSTLTLSSPCNYRSDSSSSNLLEDPNLAVNGGKKVREDVLRAHPSLSSDIFRLLEAAGLDLRGHDLGQSSTSIVSSEAESSNRDSTSTLHHNTCSSSSIGRNSSPVWGLEHKLEDEERGDEVRNSREVVSFLGT